MDRALLATMLEAMKPQASKAKTYQFSEDQKAALHIGEPLDVMEIKDLATVTLHDAFIEVESRETKSRHFLVYEAVHGAACAAEGEQGSKKTGF